MNNVLQVFALLIHSLQSLAWEVDVERDSTLSSLWSSLRLEPIVSELFKIFLEWVQQEDDIFGIASDVSRV